MGMIAVAWPEPEGMKKLMMFWAISMAMAEPYLPRPVMTEDSACTTVSMMTPFCMITRMARARPTTTMPMAISLNAVSRLSLICSGLKPAMMETTRAEMMNTALISFSQKPSFREPYTMVATVRIMDSRMIFCLVVKSTFSWRSSWKEEKSTP